MYMTTTWLCSLGQVCTEYSISTKQSPLASPVSHASQVVDHGAYQDLLVSSFPVQINIEPSHSPEEALTLTTVKPFSNKGLGHNYQIQ